MSSNETVSSSILKERPDLVVQLSPDRNSVVSPRPERRPRCTRIHPYWLNPCTTMRDDIPNLLYKKIEPQFHYTRQSCTTTIEPSDEKENVDPEDNVLNFESDVPPLHLSASIHNNSPSSDFNEYPNEKDHVVDNNNNKAEFEDSL